MPREKKFKDRINDLRLQYGSTSKLADSLNVSERTIYRWLNRDKAPKGLENRLEQKTGNADALERREYYFNVEKPRKEFKKRRETEPFEFKAGELIERPIIIFDSAQVTDRITELTENDLISSSQKYEVEVNYRNPETRKQWDTVRNVYGFQLKNPADVESLAWSFLRIAYQMEGEENVQITLTSIQSL